MTASWYFLFVAGAFEIICTTLFRYTEGFSKLLPTLAFLAAGVASLYCLNRSITGETAIPLGTAYAVWTGIGAAGTAVIGLSFYGEPATALRLVFLSLLITSIIGLKLVATS